MVARNPNNYSLKIEEDGCIEEYYVMRGDERIAFLDACSQEDALLIVEALNHLESTCQKN
jgi:hypothetical protein